MDRRSFLVLGGALALAGCTQSTDPTPRPSGTPASDPDDTLRAATAASELGLIAAYRATIAAFPALAPQLRPMAAQHEEHLAAVAPASTAAPASPGPVPAAPSATPVPSGTERRSSRSALAELVDEEAAAQRARTEACDGAQDADLARLLCLVAASEGQHAAALAALAEQGAG